MQEKQSPSYFKDVILYCGNWYIHSSTQHQTMVTAGNWWMFYHETNYSWFTYEHEIPGVHVQ